MEYRQDLWPQAIFDYKLLVKGIISFSAEIWDTSSRSSEDYTKFGTLLFTVVLRKNTSRNNLQMTKLYHHMCQILDPVKSQFWHGSGIDVTDLLKLQKDQNDRKSEQMLTSGLRIKQLYKALFKYLNSVCKFLKTK